MVNNIFDSTRIALPEMAAVYAGATGVASEIVSSNTLKSTFCQFTGTANNVAFQNLWAEQLATPIQLRLSSKTGPFYCYYVRKNENLAASVRVIYFNGSVLGNMNAVLEELLEDPTKAAEYAEARSNFTWFLTGKLVHETMRLMVTMVAPGALIKDKKTKTVLSPSRNFGNKVFSDFGNCFEMQLFGGILQLVSWLGYRPRIKRTSYNWDICLQRSEDVTSVAKIVTIHPTNGPLQFTAAVDNEQLMVCVTGASIEKSYKKRPADEISHPSLGGPLQAYVSDVDKDGVRVTIRFAL